MATQSIPQLQSPVAQSKAPAVVVPAAFPKPITQEDILLRGKVETLKGLEADLKQGLETGATVEDGIHIARLKHGSRNVAWREVATRLADRLFGNGKGEPYCERVLSSTKPTSMVSLEVR